MDYAAIISALTFFGALKAHQLGYFHWLFSALFVVFFPFLINTIVIYAILFGWDFVLATLVSVQTILIVSFQIASSVVIFRLIEWREDSISFWLTTALLGYTVLYWIIPAFIEVALR